MHAWHPKLWLTAEALHINYRYCTCMVVMMQVGMVMPQAGRLTMQLAGVSDEGKRATIAEDAKFPVKLDEGYGGKKEGKKRDCARTLILQLPAQSRLSNLPVA